MVSRRGRPSTVRPSMAAALVVVATRLLVAPVLLGHEVERAGVASCGCGESWSALSLMVSMHGYTSTGFMLFAGDAVGGACGLPPCRDGMRQLALLLSRQHAARSSSGGLDWPKALLWSYWEAQSHAQIALWLANGCDVCMPRWTLSCRSLCRDALT